MPRRTKLERAEQPIVRTLRNSGANVYTHKILAELFYSERDRGVLARHTNLKKFLTFLTDNDHLIPITLKAEKYEKTLTRYSLQKPTALELAISISKSGYLSHGSAAEFHGLIKTKLQTLYFNVEQSVKPSNDQPLTQTGIDRAFNGRQRLSNLTYRYGDISITMLNGKNTNRLGVILASNRKGPTISVTNVERTLIDITVRPAYAGGISSVLEIYRSARNQISSTKLVSTLNKLGHIYPYAQAIGFLMQRTGYSESAYEPLMTQISQLNFYLTHGIKNPEYDRTWKLYYPSTISNSAIKEF